MIFGLPTSSPVIGHALVNLLFFRDYFNTVVINLNLSLMRARGNSMSSFVYVLVFVTCSMAYHSCVTTTSTQTFASRQECLEAAGRMVGIQSATANRGGCSFSKRREDSRGPSPIAVAARRPLNDGCPERPQIYSFAQRPGPRGARPHRLPEPHTFVEWRAHTFNPSVPPEDLSA